MRACPPRNAWSFGYYMRNARCPNRGERCPSFNPRSTDALLELTWMFHSVIDPWWLSCHGVLLWYWPYWLEILHDAIFGVFRQLYGRAALDCNIINVFPARQFFRSRIGALMFCWIAASYFLGLRQCLVKYDMIFSDTLVSERVENWKLCPLSGEGRRSPAYFQRETKTEWKGFSERVCMFKSKFKISFRLSNCYFSIHSSSLLRSP